MGINPLNVSVSDTHTHTHRWKSHRSTLTIFELMRRTPAYKQILLICQPSQRKILDSGHP